MLLTPQVPPPPAPVAPTRVTFSVRYLLVRGDGHTKLLDSLLDTKTEWQAPGFNSITGSPGGGGVAPEIVIPLDLLTALRLGLIQESELALPEGVKALFNMIK